MAAAFALERDKGALLTLAFVLPLAETDRETGTHRWSHSRHRRPQGGSETLHDRRRRLNGVDRADALPGVHRHRLDVAAGAREREVDRVARYAVGDVSVL